MTVVIFLLFTISLGDGIWLIMDLFFLCAYFENMFLFEISHL